MNVSVHFTHRKERLEAERRKLQGMLERACAGAAESLAGVGDLHDTYQLEQRRGTAAAQVTFLSDQLAAVDAALQSLEDGTYGRCDGCGEDIPSARLEALPFAKRCVGCQELVESQIEDRSPRRNLGPFADLR